MRVDGFYALNARSADESLRNLTPFQLPRDTTPRLVFQDDAFEQEAEIDALYQFEVTFGQAAPDQINRSLVLMQSGLNDFWYLRIYSYQEESWDDLRELDLATLEAAVAAAQTALDADPDDPDLQQALADAEAALDRFNEFAEYHVNGTVAVGERVEAPDAADSVAGYVSSGTPTMLAPM